MGFYFNPEAIKRRRLQRLNIPQKSDLKNRDDIVNCHSCRHLTTCEHPKKDFSFKCNKYESFPGLTSAEDYLSLMDPDEIKRIEEEEREAIDNIEAMINQAIKDQESGIQTDFLLEDGDIPLAKNFVDFCFNPRYEGEVKPMAKQTEIICETLTEVCYNPKCTDVSYAECMPNDATIDQLQERVTFLENGVCPRCKQNRFDMWNTYKRKKASTMGLCSGQRSGKDWTTGLLCHYQDHRYLKLRNPGKVLGLASGAMLYQTFTGVNFGQARTATFLPYLDFVEKSKWFKEYHAMLDHVSHKAGKKLYNIGKEAIIWNYHGLASVVQSPDVRALRGIARRAYSVTEVAYFYTKTKGAVKLDGPGIIEALQNSTAGVLAGYNRCLERGMIDIPPSLEIMASSPRSIKDYMMQLVRLAPKSNSIVTRHYSTFDFNPNIKPSDLEDFKLKNPELYRTSILAIPSNAVKAFMPDWRVMRACIGTRQNAFKAKNKKITSGSKMMTTSADVRFNSKGVDKTTPKVLFLDGGEVNNSFALCLAHVVRSETNTGLEQNITVIDGLMEVIPSKARPADYPDILDNIILPICEEFNVKLVVADRYAGTIHHLQTVNKELEIEGLKRSIGYADFVRFRQDAIQAVIDIPKLEIEDWNTIQQLGQNNYPISFDGKPVAHMLQQAVTVEDMMGKKVDKGEGFTDDLFYAMVGAHAVCNDENMIEDFLSTGFAETIQDEVIGVSVSTSGAVQEIDVRGGARTNSDYDMAVSVSYRDF